jgi:hypothetical protein
VKQLHLPRFFLTALFNCKKMQEEIWKDVVNYEDSYRISNLGKLMSIERIVIYSDKKSGKRKSKILKTRVGKCGYEYTVLSVDRIRKTQKIHRLVALTFIPNPENKPSVNHINGIKDDNRVENLEWCTAKENTQHAYRTKLNSGVKGEKSHLSKLKKEDIIKIRLMHKEGLYSQSKLGLIFNVSQSQIYRIIKHLNW